MDLLFRSVLITPYYGLHFNPGFQQSQKGPLIVIRAMSLLTWHWSIQFTHVILRIKQRQYRCKNMTVIHTSYLDLQVNGKLFLLLFTP